MRRPGCGRQYGNFQKRTCGKRRKAVFTFRTKVNSRSPNPQLLIALHSPNGLRETGLRMCPPEKSRDSDPDLTRAVRSLQSGLLSNYREMRASFAHFGGKDGGISLQLRLAGGAGRIRTLGTGLMTTRADVLISYPDQWFQPEIREFPVPSVLVNQCGFSSGERRRIGDFRAVTQLPRGTNS